MHKASKTQKVGKRIPSKVVSTITISPPKTRMQRALTGAAQIGQSLLTGNKSQAVIDAFSTAYDIAGMSSQGGLTGKVVAAPVSRGTILRSSGDVVPKQVHVGPDTIRVKGRAEIMRLEVGVTNYFVYDVAGNSISLTLGQRPLFPLTMSPAGAAVSTPTDINPLYAATFTTPVRLRNIAQLYTFWRYENLRFTFVPVVSTSTNGSLSLAWTPQANTSVNTTSVPDLWGPGPGSPLTLSQLPHFVQTPAWQGVSLSVNPRSHGITENKGDWLATTYITSSAQAGISSTLTSSGVQCGCLALAMQDFPVTASAYTLGYLMMDYDITFHESNPLIYLSQLYSISDFLQSPCNKDLLDTLNERRRIERKTCGDDYLKTRSMRGYKDSVGGDPASGDDPAGPLSLTRGYEVVAAVEPGRQTSPSPPPSDLPMVRSRR